MEKKKIRAGKELAERKVAGSSESSESVFKRVISYKYPQVVSEPVQVPDNKIGLEKVVNTVTTFLNEDREGSHIIRGTTTQTASEKVVATVTTFLNKDREGSHIIRTTTIKTASEKVYITWTAKTCRKSELRQKPFI